MLRMDAEVLIGLVGELWVHQRWGHHASGTRHCVSCLLGTCLRSWSEGQWRTSSVPHMFEMPQFQNKEIQKSFPKST